MSRDGRIPEVAIRPAGAMPLLGLGTWQLDAEDGRAAIRHALDVGYRHLDTASSYGNEEDVGRAVRESGLSREELFITTKLPPWRVGQERETLEESLRALGLDHVDLWLIHAPPGGEAGPDTWQRLLDARAAGHARAVGVSNYSLAQIDELVAATGEPPAVNQVKWAPALHDPEVLEGHRARGVVLEGHSPFRATDLGDPVLVEIAQRHGVTPAQVVVRWHLQHEIVVIPRSSDPRRIEANADVFGFELGEGEMRRIDGMSRVGA